MSDNSQPDSFVIRRRGDDDLDEHKGGVWKIAYADFMTAMMAFFLVMWLINATDQDTREGVATYFNPIKFAEATFDRKGLRDPSRRSNETEQEPAAPSDGRDPQSSPQRAERSEAPRDREAALFRDPYAVLADLASRAPEPRGAGPELTPGDRGEPGLVGGSLVRDPFDPVYWQLGRNPQAGRANGDRSAGLAGPADAAAALPRPPAGGERPASKSPDPAPVEARTTDLKVVETKPIEVASAEAKPVEGKTVESKPIDVKRVEGGFSPHKGEERAASAPAPVPGDAKAAASAELADVKPGPEAQAAREAAAGWRKAEDLRSRLTAAMNAVLGPAPGGAPRLDVAATPEGVLVSLTDDAAFGMFAVGSAEPKPEVVKVLEKVAAVLAAERGALVIRGHTDGRPFRSKDYDNWRLSTARAHMASYMLVRGGFDEGRIERVEGHADRLLKVASDPQAAQNRRIEILLRGERS